MRITMILAGWLLALLPAAAQVQVAVPLLQSPGADRPVVLQSAALSVERAGSLAHTTIELVLHNPSGRPLEGQLAFPLRPGQEVSGFALDIGGHMHDAVPVAKERGREVFEAIERRNVDPALLERTEGNHFRLRVFPVPAGGERRVRIELVESLEATADGWQLRLPLQFAQGLSQLPLGVHGGAPTANGLGFTTDGSRSQVMLDATQLRRRDGFVLAWPKDGASVVQAQGHDGDTWFHADVALPGTATARALPKRIGLLWDASGSARQRDRGLEFALLDRYFAAVGNADVQLQLLRDRASAPQAFRVRGGDWSAIKAVLREAVLDGGSNLADWRVDKAVQEYLLVSDGLGNYGGSPFPALAPSQRLFAINGAGAKADAARLRALAEARGGRLVDIAGQDGLERAARELLQDLPRLLAIDAVGADDVVAASIFPEDGRVRLAGRLTGGAATLTLTFAEGRRTREQRIVLPAVAAGEGRFVAQVWAGYRLRALLADPAGNRTRIAELGKRFGLVTAETSLIVLETLEDYVRYDIAPPMPWRAAFDAQRTSIAQAEGVRRKEHLAQVIAEFEERQRWWETDFRGRVHLAADTAQPTVAEASADAAMPSAASEAPSPIAIPAPPPSPALAAPAAAPRSDAPRQRAMGGAREEAERAAADDAAAQAVAAQAAGTTIHVQPWQPASPFATRLRAAPGDQVYALYLDERDAHAASPAFYLDVADILLEKGQRALALRVLSNLAELDLENRALLRVLGYRLVQAGEAEQAVPVFERVRAIAGEEPQSWRDLGLALDATGRHQDAIDALYEVVVRPWDGRFGGIAQTALAELNAIAARHDGRVDLSAVDLRLRRNLPVAMRAVLTWDADNTDMDLWVTQPDGEQASYSNRATAVGGRMSQDFTGGYGPEEYVIRRAPSGRYRIEAHYYGSREQLVSGAVTVQVWLATGFGTKAQDDRRVMVRLLPDSDHLLVGEFDVQ